VQRGQQPVHPDGDARGGDRLAREALDEIVVAPAARDRAELARAALLVEDLEGQFGLEDGAGVVAEATDDGGVDDDAVGAVALGVEERGDLLKLVHAFGSNSRASHCVAKIPIASLRASLRGQESQHNVRLIIREADALNESS
jgi:hypothetical protein